jgi:hypothetical protein
MKKKILKGKFFSYNRMVCIPGQRIRSDPSVGIRRNLSVGFDRPLLLISSFNKLVPVANFRGRSKPPIVSVEFRQDLYEVSSD